jgi:hypothetical protein
MDPEHGGSPHVLGIVDSVEGVTFTSTEADGRSNALINWVLGANRTLFKAHGTVSFWFRADREDHVSGVIFGDNYGYDKFRNGQGSFEARASRIVNGEGTEDDQVQLSWSSWHNGVWYFPTDPSPLLEYDRWYLVGYAWGGPANDFEIWVDGELVSAYDLPSGVGFPWGQEVACCPSGINFGIGSNHERGMWPNYHSVAGVTYAEIRIWDEYRSQGDTTSDLVLICPPGGSTLSSTPSFGWGSGGYDVYLFISVFYYDLGYWTGYHPVRFWLSAVNNFEMPSSWWDLVDTASSCYWAVLGINTATRDWGLAGPWSFTKAP